MAYYKLTSCPYCKHYLASDYLKKGGWNDLDNILGTPTGLCSNCGKSYFTGRQTWSNLRSSKKFELHLRMSVGILFSSVVYTGLLLAILYGIAEIFNAQFVDKLFKSIDEHPVKLLFFFIPNLCWMIFTHIYELKELIKKHP